MILPNIQRRGFTLLEVILAVSLTAIIATMIATAIDYHLRQLTARRTQIREAQLARAILRQIGDDLRGVVVHRPPISSSLEELSESFEGAEGLISGEQDLAEFEEEQDAAELTTDTTSDLSSAPIVAVTPGLFGNESQLQIDVSRIPRPEEYSLLAEFGDPSQMRLLSDVKTVTYFIVSDPMQMVNAAPNPDAANPESATAGLGRRTIDRATSRFANDNGIFDLMDQNVEMLAPEITALQFAYFDGVEWSMEWDSELRGGIPVAVEISLVILPEEEREFDTRVEMESAMNNISTDHIYRLVVYLPGSDAVELAGFAAGETEDADMEASGL